jgi:hypothetical protein
MVTAFSSRMLKWGLIAASSALVLVATACTSEPLDTLDTDEDERVDDGPSADLSQASSATCSRKVCNLRKTVSTCSHGEYCEFFYACGTHRPHRCVPQKAPGSKCEFNVECRSWRCEKSDDPNDCWGWWCTMRCK